MAVFITDPDAFTRLCAVEGERYLLQGHATVGAHSFATHAAAFATWARDAETMGVPLADLAFEPVGDGIYGLSGYHRYIVCGDGRIVFSRHHATPEGIARAKAAGFDLG